MQIERNLGSIPSPTFDRGGEINADSKQDALRQLVKLAQDMLNTPDSTVALASSKEPLSAHLTGEEQNRIISSFDVQSNRLALGQAMANPIRKHLDYRGVMRRALKVDPLAQGAIPVYDFDVEGIQAVTVAANGAVPESKVYGSRITVDMFELAANPTVRIREVKIRRFNVIDRIQVKSRQYLQEQEDDNIIAVLDTASGIENAVVTTAASNYMAKADLMHLFREVEKHDLFVQNLFMSIYRFGDFRLWDRDEVDPVTQKAVLETGLFARLWNGNIYVTRRMPQMSVFATSEPEFVGVIPVYQDIEVLPADEPREMKLGWVFALLWGILVTNQKGVAKLTVKA